MIDMGTADPSIWQMRNAFLVTAGSAGVSLNIYRTS